MLYYDALTHVTASTGCTPKEKPRPSAWRSRYATDVSGVLAGGPCRGLVAP